MELHYFTLVLCMFSSDQWPSLPIPVMGITFFLQFYLCRFVLWDSMKLSLESPRSIQIEAILEQHAIKKLPAECCHLKNTGLKRSIHTNKKTQCAKQVKDYRYNGLESVRLPLPATQSARIREGSGKQRKG